MESAIEEMETQLRLWTLKIDHLAAETQMVGVRASFEALIYIDELKALHAIAQSKLDKFRAAPDTGRSRLKAEMTRAWEDLEAMGHPRRTPR